MNIPTAKQFQANEKFARYKPPAQYEFNAFSAASAA